MGRKKTVTGECVYCGEIKSLEKEDVIPRCLFLKPRPNDLVKVPVCRDCNLGKSKNDDYLRDILVTDADTFNNTIAQAIFHEKTLSSVRQNSSLLARDAMSKGKSEAMYTPNGIYLGEGIGVPINGERIKNIFTQITRGLYFKSRQKRIPDEYVFEVSRVHPLTFNEVWKGLQQIGYNGPYKIGEGVFTCVYLYAAEDEFITKWWLWFYESICISVATDSTKQIILASSLSKINK